MQIDTIMELLQTTLFHIGEYPINSLQLMLSPSVVILGFVVIRWVANLITSKLIQRNVDADAAHLFNRVFYVVAIGLLVITLLDLLAVPVTAFAFVSGAVAIGVGFGAQNIINNFISGWILMWERPIKIGDFLETSDGTKGTVESINTRSTRIRRSDGVHMLIPNSFLLENTVVNWTLIDRLTRTQVRVGVAYGSPVKKVAELIDQAVNEQEGVLNEPPPAVIFEDFGDSALIFDAYMWIIAGADRDLRRIRSNIRFRIVELFEQNDIEISFPQRDVHVDGVLNIRNEIGT